MPSSVVAGIRYEAAHARLTITFNGGRVYQYFLVPPNVAADFQAAPSKGAFFNLNIRARYACREVERPKRSAR